MGIKRENVIISLKAQESIKSIFEHLLKNSSSATAKSVKSAIIAKCKELKNFAGYSKEVYLEELKGDYRSVTIWDYCIIYSITETHVKVLNVIHTGMHPQNRTNI